MKIIRNVFPMVLILLVFPSCWLIQKINPYTGTGIAQFSMAPGRYSGTIELTFDSRTDAATIVYTTDGTDPSIELGTVFDGNPIVIDADTTIKAIAYLDCDVAPMNVGMYSIGGSPVLYALGETGPAGGIIVHDKGDYEGGWRYMETVFPEQRHEGDTWGYYPPGTAYEIGSGYENTIRILDCNGSASEASAYCWNLEYGGFEDWFLPSVQELEAVMEYLATEGNSYDGRYWSSTDSNDLDWVHSVIVGNGIVGSSGMIDMDSTRDHALTLPVRRF